MKLEVMLEEEEDGTYSVHCPALKGCHSQGATREEALKMLQISNLQQPQIFDLGQHP